MESRGVFAAAGALIAGLLSVGFLSPAQDDRQAPPPANAGGEYPLDGRAGGRYGVNGLGDPELPPNAPVNAELDAVFADEIRVRQAEARDEGEKPAKRSFWDRVLGRKREAAGNPAPAAEPR